MISQKLHGPNVAVACRGHERRSLLRHAIDVGILIQKLAKRWDVVVGLGKTLLQASIILHLQLPGTHVVRRTSVSEREGIDTQSERGTRERGKEGWGTARRRAMWEGRR